MAYFSIYARNGYTFVSIVTQHGDYTLGFPSGVATQRVTIDAWAAWAYALAEEGAIPFSLAESLADTLEMRAEAYLPAPIRWLRRLGGTGRKHS